MKNNEFKKAREEPRHVMHPPGEASGRGPQKMEVVELVKDNSPPCMPPPMGVSDWGREQRFLVFSAPFHWTALSWIQLHPALQQKELSGANITAKCFVSFYIMG